MKKKIVFSLLFLFAGITISWAGKIWKSKDPARFISANCHKDEKLTDNTFGAFQLNLSRLRKQAASAPENDIRHSNTVINIPYPDGTLRTFRIIQAGTMSKELQAQYPQIRSYSGEMVENPSVTARFDFNESGFHALVRELTDQVVIEPFCSASKAYYVCYFKSTYRSVRSAEMR